MSAPKVDVHELLRTVEEQRQARAEQFPDEQVCIRMMIQCRLRLEELGWRSIDYAPRDGSMFESISAGFTGPSDTIFLGSGFMIAEGGDLWPAKPMVFRAKQAEQAGKDQP